MLIILVVIQVLSRKREGEGEWGEDNEGGREALGGMEGWREGGREGAINYLYKTDDMAGSIACGQAAKIGDGGVGELRLLEPEDAVLQRGRNPAGIRWMHERCIPLNVSFIGPWSAPDMQEDLASDSAEDV